MNGINITKKQFLRLNQNQQLEIIYSNTEQLKKMIKDYKLKQKIVSIWLGLLTVGMGFGKFLGFI